MPRWVVLPFPDSLPTFEYSPSRGSHFDDLFFLPRACPFAMTSSVQVDWQSERLFWSSPKNWLELPLWCTPPPYAEGFLFRATGVWAKELSTLKPSWFEQPPLVCLDFAQLPECSTGLVSPEINRGQSPAQKVQCEPVVAEGGARPGPIAMTTLGNVPTDAHTPVDRARMKVVRRRSVIDMMACSTPRDLVALPGSASNTAQIPPTQPSSHALAISGFVSIQNLREMAECIAAAEEGAAPAVLELKPKLRGARRASLPSNMGPLDVIQVPHRGKTAAAVQSC